MQDDFDMNEHRTPNYPIDLLFVNRWSPRALSGESLEQDQLNSLFEAARWAPSSSNGQPWRFVYAHRQDAEWPLFVSFLAEGNRLWAEKAAVLLVILSRREFEHNDRPNMTHSFDTGSSWQNLALQASLSGLVAHAMRGFDAERAATELGVPQKYRVEAMVAIGRPGRKEDLPEHLQQREVPSGRKTVEEFVMQGRFRD